MRTWRAIFAVCAMLLATGALVAQQPNSVVASATFDGHNGPAWPIAANVPITLSSQGNLDLKVSGGYSRGFIVAQQPSGLSPGWLPTPAGIVDFDASGPVQIVMDGIFFSTGSFLDSAANTGLLGSVTFQFPISAASIGDYGGFQCAVADPASPYGYTLTAATALTIYDGIIYVSATTGSSTNPGTAAAPLSTITAGIAAANALPSKGSVVVATGTYVETPTFAASIDVYGGFDPNTWTPVAGARSLIQCAASGVVFNGGARPTTFANLDVTPAAMTGAGNSSVAARLFGTSNQTTFLNCRFAPSNGVAGSAGTNGTAGANGGNGNPGFVSSGGTPATGAGGLGGGGSVGNGGTNGMNGSAGAAGGLGGNAGANGTCGSVVAGGGFAGASGQAGTGGGSGNGGAAVPTLSNALVFTAAAGTAGVAGASGGGGGGGGAGGTYFQTSLFCGTVLGGGGGSGGAAGLGGTGGSGGGGGGSSIGLAIFGGIVQIQNCVFVIGNGGQGGTGGSGGAGGNGGTGGAGAAASNSNGGTGGAGGAGGAGGKGGPGGGGGGGAALGVAARSAYVIISNPNLSLGAPGVGGAGGTTVGLPQAPAGATGAAGLAQFL